MSLMIQKFWLACNKLAEDGVDINGATHFIDDEVTELVRGWYGYDCFVFVSIHTNEITILTKFGYVILNFDN